MVLVAAYFVAFAAVGSPDAVWARLASWFPLTAPFAMPNRIAMGAASWWDPVLAAVLTLGAIVGLVVLGGRVYSHALLHSGGVMKLRDAWYGASTGTTNVATKNAFSTPPRSANDALVSPTPAEKTTGGRTYALAAGVAVAIGAPVIAYSHDVIMGLTRGGGSFTVVLRSPRARMKSRR